MQQIILVSLAIILFLIAYGFGLAMLAYFSVRLVSSVITHRYGAPYVPLERDVVDLMVTYAALKPGETVYDLGSGDGRILIAACSSCDVHGIGYEVAWYPLWLSKWNIRRKMLNDRIRVERRNFFEVDLSDADVIMLYQTPIVQRKLVPKFKRELKSGTRIIAARYPIEGWEPQQVDASAKYPVYVYVVK
jgi:hypothetical protein